MPRAWGTVGTGQAGEAYAQARIAGWQGRDTGTGGPGAQGPGPPGDQMNARAIPATVPPSLGELRGQCRGPETGRKKRAGGRPRLSGPGDQSPVRPGECATEGGEETRAGHGQWAGERGRTALAGGLGAEARAYGPTLGGLGRSGGAGGRGVDIRYRDTRIT